MSTTNIEWTDRVWNPVTGCTKVSAGCKNCYAEKVADRFWAAQYPPVEYPTYSVDNCCPITEMRARRFTDVQTHEDRLREPLSWRKPSRVFVNSMSDLFHEDVPIAFTDRVFTVMALAHQHTFQVLTKRPERMKAYIESMNRPSAIARAWAACAWAERFGAGDAGLARIEQMGRAPGAPNVWLGVSVENQETADERIPLLLQTPAAVRFISAEPLLGPVDLVRTPRAGNMWDWLTGERETASEKTTTAALDWVIVGGESGPGARRCHVAWVRCIREHCHHANVPVFVKQLGANIIDRNDAGFMGEEPDHWPDHIDIEDRVEHDLSGFRDGYQGAPVRVHLRDRKGGDMSEWPEDLRVREFPRVQVPA